VCGVVLSCLVLSVIQEAEETSKPESLALMHVRELYTLNS
jgi:hypothetical protein